MSHLAGIPDQAPTLEEHNAQVAASGRNYTDPPIGGSRGSQSKRAIDAELSAIVTEVLGYVPDRRQRHPESPDCPPEGPLLGGNHPKGT